MEKWLKLLAEQNQFFDPDDRLSRLVRGVLEERQDDELSEEDLMDVQAARGQVFTPLSDKEGK